MYRLVPALVAEMGAAYPELVRAQPLIEATLQQEETRFRQTLVNGLKLLDEATGGAGARAARCPARPRSSSTTPSASPTTSPRTRCARAGCRSTAPASTRPWPSRRPRRAPPGRARAPRRTRTSGSTSPRNMARPSSPAIRATKARAWCSRSSRTARASSSAEVGETVDVLLNQTPFYGESGGQIGDTGKLTTLKGFVGEVEDTSKPLGKLHVLRTKVVAGELSVGETVHQKVDAERRDRIRANHSATHLLHAALRRHLGTHVTQKGSLVAPDYFRFDFSHPKALTREEIDAVEAEVNAQIRSQRAGHDAADDPRRGDLGRRDGPVRREIWRRGARALDGPARRRRLFGRAVRRHARPRARRHPAVQDHQRKRGLVGRSPDRGADRRGGAAMAQRARGEAARGRGDAEEPRPTRCPRAIAALVEERRRLERELAEAKKALAMGGGAAKSEASGARGGQRPQVPRPGRRRLRSQGLARRC